MNYFDGIDQEIEITARVLVDEQLARAVSSGSMESVSQA
jgi:hypothetical protein